MSSGSDWRVRLSHCSQQPRHQNPDLISIAWMLKCLLQCDFYANHKLILLQMSSFFYCANFLDYLIHTDDCWWEFCFYYHYVFNMEYNSCANRLVKPNKLSYQIIQYSPTIIYIELANSAVCLHTIHHRIID